MNITSEIKMSFEKRPCEINGEKALFHMFYTASRIVPPSLLKGGHSGGVVSGAMAIIEHEGGVVETVPAECVVFLDSTGVFQEYDFREHREEESRE